MGFVSNYCEFYVVFGIRAHAIMNCPLCVEVSSYVDSPLGHRFDHRNFISCVHVHVCPVVHAHRILGQGDLKFSNFTLSNCHTGIFSA